MTKFLLFSFVLSFIIIYGCNKSDPPKFQPTVITDNYFVDSIAYGSDTALLSGSATDKDGSVVAYLWTLVSGPSLPQILSPGQASTFVTALQKGTYIFQLMVTDNEGLTGFAMDTLLVVEKTKTTLIIKNPSTIHELLLSGDTYYDISDAVTTELSAYNWTMNGVSNYGQSAFEFDLYAIPKGKTITSAMLSLYSSIHPKNGNLVDANYGSDNALFLERITSAWSDVTTMQTKPSTDEQHHISIPQSNMQREDLVDIDVTAMVQQMVSDNNYGFMIRMQHNNIYNSRIFVGSRNADTARHPVLTVIF